MFIIIEFYELDKIIKLKNKKILKFLNGTTGTTLERL